MTSNKLTSSTGYFKRTGTGEVFLSPLWLGCWDSAENYEKISEEEYDEARARELELIYEESEDQKEIDTEVPEVVE